MEKVKQKQVLAQSKSLQNKLDQAQKKREKLFEIQVNEGK